MSSPREPAERSPDRQREEELPKPLPWSVQTLRDLLDELRLIREYGEDLLRDLTIDADAKTEAGKLKRMDHWVEYLLVHVSAYSQGAIPKGGAIILKPAGFSTGLIFISICKYLDIEKLLQVRISISRDLADWEQFCRSAIEFVPAWAPGGRVFDFEDGTSNVPFPPEKTDEQWEAERKRAGDLKQVILVGLGHFLGVFHTLEVRIVTQIDEIEAANDQVDYVTLDQMAGIVNRSKRTLQRFMGKLPEPHVEGGGGKACEWRWDVVRPLLEKEYGRLLPARFLKGSSSDRR